jgi:predicted alpha/beta-hydrolase family hydrolase
MILGWLHEPAGVSVNRGLVMTHGAGSNCESPLLRSLAEHFAEAGFHVLRCDLPYRQKRPTGPPTPGQSAKDREGLAAAAEAMRRIVPFVVLGGHSYGGRQSTMVSAENPQIADALLLLSYPLHPPRKPEQLRNGHFGEMHTPSLFLHGTRDPFASIDELQMAITAIPARHDLVPFEKTGHELSPQLAPAILRETLLFLAAVPS